MATRLHRQAERFYAAFSELVRAYQFRDREGICCHGLSVTQCYALEALGRHGAMSMGQLARHMSLDLSTMTRAVDQLVSKGLATRREGADDRRVRQVDLSAKGRELLARVQAGLVAEYEQVLGQVPAASRPAVIEAVSHLLEAFQRRGDTCAAPGARP